jgi:hypothetical protein
MQSGCGPFRGTENPVAFPAKFAYFYESEACYENNGLCALWEGAKPPILATHQVLRFFLEKHMAAIAQ